MSNHTWSEHVMFLIALAKDMRKDKDECLLLTVEVLQDERDRFIRMIPEEVPATCKAVLADFFHFLYAVKPAQGQLLKEPRNERA